ncbi:forkhead box protein N2 [Anguilla anguilla]|uniref:forkhead box protein N2 n=1 Tax=Anguilla anguilla TaxID=7936 RepID=UPI0015B25EB9|nr:forkhead box protein N2 [Anguilla anguilla]
METDSCALPLLPPSLHSSLTLCQAVPSLPFTPQPSPPLATSFPLSPLSPSHSVPPSPTSAPFSAPDSAFQSNPLSPPQPPKSPAPLSQGSNPHCLSLTASSDQDDLTCLSWLHQRGDLLPLQPLPKTAPLPQLAQPDSLPAQHLPPSPSKPPYSFSSLIFMAIEDSLDKRLPVKGIYEWIVKSFPYYRAAPGGWRNSVRHNLSLNKSFRRIHREKGQSVGKGSLWYVCPEYRPALLEVLRKSHYCHKTNNNLYNKPLLLEGGDLGEAMECDTVEISDSLSQTLLLSSLSPPTPTLPSEHPTLSSDPPCPLPPDHEELVTMEAVELQEEIAEEVEKDPLADSGYIEFHYYQYHQYQYLVLPGETELDLETVEILQLDAEAQEAAGSLLDLAGGGH